MRKDNRVWVKDDPDHGTVTVDESDQSVTIGIDVDGDGDNDIDLKFIITNKWFWITITGFTLGLVIASKLGWF